MAIKPLRLKTHDLQPAYPFSVTDALGVVVDLSGATITATMIDESGTKKVNRAACTITDAASGLAEYQWSGTDTDTAGTYRIEFEVVPAVGGKFTVPASDKTPAFVIIAADYDAV